MGESQVVQVLKDLISIESVNPRLPGGARGEVEMIAYVNEWCSRLGLERVEAGGYPDRRNAVWQLRVPGASASLLFEAHMDTVTLANMPAGTTPRLADGRLYGRGACDTKGSLAAMLCAVAELAKNPAGLQANILVGGILEEELGCVGARLLVESGLRPTAAVVGEPTRLQPVIAHKGVTRFYIATRGRSAHSSQPEFGDNAIVQMAEVIRFLKTRVEPTLAQHSHPLVGHPVQTIALIQGGHQLNFVPEGCRIGIDRRVLPNEDPAQVLAGYEEAIAQLCREQPWVHAAIDEVHTLMPGLDTPPEAPVVQAAVAAVQKRFDPGARACGAPYGTNAAQYWGLAQIPSVVLGPGDIAQAHTAEEWIAVEQLEAAVPVYVELARQFAN